MLSPIKHLKFALDNFTQKTVAHLRKQEKEAKKKNSPPAIKTKTPTHTQRLTGIQCYSFCNLEINDNLLQNLP